MPNLALTVSCVSTIGIVAAISTFLAKHECNITDSAQFDDPITGAFFTRVSFKAPDAMDMDDLRGHFNETAAQFKMDWAIHDQATKMKVAIMVSRFGHCLNDLLYRWRIGALQIDIVAVSKAGRQS